MSTWPPMNSWLSRSSRTYAPVLPTANSAAESPQGRQPQIGGLYKKVCHRTFWRAFPILIALLLLVDILQRRSKVHWSLGSHQDDIAQEGEPDWSEYAYCQYVTNADYLCNSVMIFEALERLESKASRVMMYPQGWTADSDTKEGRLLAKARDDYRVALKPIEVQHFSGDQTWADSFTKLLAFNQTDYRRVLSLDSDATVLQVRAVLSKYRLELTCMYSPWTSCFLCRQRQWLCRGHIGSTNHTCPHSWSWYNHQRLR